jgi:hypothetical protein
MERIVAMYQELTDVEFQFPYKKQARVCWMFRWCRDQEIINFVTRYLNQHKTPFALQYHINYIVQNVKDFR